MGPLRTNFVAARCESSRQRREGGDELRRSPARDGAGPRRRFAPGLLPLVLLCAARLLSASDCIPIHEASQHVGETKCVEGKVVRVKVGDRGVHFLDFCEARATCPFSVVVFPSGMKDVGDVRRLAGRTIEIKGPVKIYDGRAEIVLNRISQITGGAAMIPPLPKNYDVENRGHYSPGHLRPSKKPAKVKATPNPSATYGNDVEGEEPPD